MFPRPFLLSVEDLRELRQMASKASYLESHRAISVCDKSVGNET